MKLKEQLRRDGFSNSAILDEATFDRAKQYLDEDPRRIDTPEPELRYIEGLLSLPFGFFEQFSVIPAEGAEQCACGRVPSALDLVVTALKKRIHDRELIRDTLIGFAPLFEFADDGRRADCITCGRQIVFGGYWTRRYMYA
jgi:hypothetical protein